MPSALRPGFVNTARYVGRSQQTPVVLANDPRHWNQGDTLVSVFTPRSRPDGISFPPELTLVDVKIGTREVYPATGRGTYWIPYFAFSPNTQITVTLRNNTSRLVSGAVTLLGQSYAP